MAITARAIDSLSDGKLMDPTRAGLSIEVVGRKKVWRYYRRIAGGGGAVRLSLGSWPAHGIADARKWADGLNEQVEAGIDPRAADRAKRAATMTVEAAHTLYMTAIEQGHRKPLRPRTIADKRTIWLRDIAPHIGAKQLGTITADDLWDMVEAKGCVAPVRANRLAAEAKVFFAWCESRAGQRAGIRLRLDPAATLNGKHYAESKGRTRFLSDDEIGWFLRALTLETGSPASSSYRRAFLLMLLTGVSRGDPDETVAAIRMRLCGRDGSEIVAARQAMQGQFGVDRRSATDRVSS
jgi:hypothetical protein